MKRALLVAAIAISVITLTAVSCTKKSSSSDPVGNYICHCVTVMGPATDTANIPQDNVKKSVAQTYCNNEQAAFTTGNPGSTVTCTLQ